VVLRSPTCTVGVGRCSFFGASPDAKDSNRTIATLRQGGCRCPTGEYYLATDAKSVEIPPDASSTH